MAETNNITIIKKKKVSGGDGHHGGAWKVAYADFVTAMMAFFLLMWLLNATTESQRKGIADYFTPDIPVSPSSAGGQGVLNGDSVFTTDTLVSQGTGGASNIKSREKGEQTSSQEGVSVLPEEENTPLEDLREELLGMSGESENEDDLLSHIVTRVTDEGLVIDVFARDGRPLFESGSEQPSERMRRILSMIAEVTGLVTNQIAIEGHTDASPFASGDRDNWGLSSGRADATRRTLVEFGLSAERMNRVVGRADRELALPEQPEDPRNRRVTITLLRSDKT